MNSFLGLGRILHSDVSIFYNAGTSVINYSPPTEATDNTVPTVCSRNMQTGGMVESVPFTAKTSSPAVSTFQLYGVMDTTAPNLLHFNY